MIYSDSEVAHATDIPDEKSNGKQEQFELLSLEIVAVAARPRSLRTDNPLSKRYPRSIGQELQL